MVARKASALKAKLITTSENPVFSGPDIIGNFRQGLIEDSPLIDKSKFMLFFEPRELNRLILLKFRDLGIMDFFQL